MRVVFHRNFEKKYIKLSARLKKRFKKRRDIFLKNEFDPQLHNHALGGKYKGYRSINITGDWRVFYKRIGRDTVVFVVIDTHSNLYI